LGGGGGGGGFFLGKKKKKKEKKTVFAPLQRPKLPISKNLKKVNFFFFFKIKTKIKSLYNKFTI